MIIRRVFLCFFVFFMFPCVGASFAEQPLNVAASLPPQEYFLKKIGGDLVKVSIMVMPGANEATYEPKPKQMMELADSKAYFAIGVPFESGWLHRFLSINKNMLIVYTDKNVSKIHMKAHYHDEEEDIKEDSHNGEKAGEGVEDPHIWLSPPLVRIQALNILNGLVAIDPKNKATYEANYKNFLNEVDEIDAKIRHILSSANTRREFMVFHPSWGYFAEAYRLKQITIEVQGKEPKPAMLKRFVDMAKTKNIKTIFVQPQFSSRSAKTIADTIGGNVVILDPLSKDWAKNLENVASKIVETLN